MSSDRPERPVVPGSDAADVPPREAYRDPSAWTVELQRDQVVNWAASVYEARRLLEVLKDGKGTSAPRTVAADMAIKRLDEVLMDMAWLRIPVPTSPSSETYAGHGPDGRGEAASSSGGAA